MRRKCSRRRGLCSRTNGGPCGGSGRAPSRRRRGRPGSERGGAPSPPTLLDRPPPARMAGLVLSWGGLPLSAAPLRFSACAGSAPAPLRAERRKLLPSLTPPQPSPHLEKPSHQGSGRAHRRRATHPQPHHGTTPAFATRQPAPPPRSAPLTRPGHVVPPQAWRFFSSQVSHPAWARGGSAKLLAAGCVLAPWSVVPPGARGALSSERHFPRPVRHSFSRAPAPQLGSQSRAPFFSSWSPQGFLCLGGLARREGHAYNLRRLLLSEAPAARHEHWLLKCTYAVSFTELTVARRRRAWERASAHLLAPAHLQGTPNLSSALSFFLASAPCE